jgi:hypothetical protein
MSRERRQVAVELFGSRVEHVVALQGGEARLLLLGRERRTDITDPPA